MIDSMATTIVPYMETNKAPDKIRNRPGKSDEFHPKLK